jgi:hypothetical protein
MARSLLDPCAVLAYSYGVDLGVSSPMRHLPSGRLPAMAYAHHWMNEWKSSVAEKWKLLGIAYIAHGRCALYTSQFNANEMHRSIRNCRGLLDAYTTEWRRWLWVAIAIWASLYVCNYALGPEPQRRKAATTTTTTTTTVATTTVTVH